MPSTSLGPSWSISANDSASSSTDEALGLAQDVAGGVPVDGTEGAGAQVVLDPIGLEQVELDVPQVGLVVRHDRPSPEVARPNLSIHSISGGVRVVGGAHGPLPGRVGDEGEDPRRHPPAARRGGPGRDHPEGHLRARRGAPGLVLQPLRDQGRGGGHRGPPGPGGGGPRPRPTAGGTRSKTWSEAYIRFIAGQPVLARIYVQLAVAGSADDHRLRGRILRHHANRLDRFAEGMARSRPGLAPAEARRRAEFLLAALQGLTIWNMLDPAFDFAAHARDLLAIALAAE